MRRSICRRKVNQTFQKNKIFKIKMNYLEIFKILPKKGLNKFED